MAIFTGKNLNILNKAQKLIFDNFSFEINKGEIWIAMGPNGIGKSSFWEALIGIGPIKSGKIFLNNVDITNKLPAERVRLGMRYIAQNNALFDDISVEENLKIVAESLLRSKERKAAIENAVKTFWLEPLLKKKPGKLSGGQRRRVELSKIMIGPSTLILMDEPFAAVDEEFTQKINQIFIQMKKNGTSFLINDHNSFAMRSIADYCIHLGLSDQKNPTSIEKIKH